MNVIALPRASRVELGFIDATTLVLRNNCLNVLRKNLRVSSIKCQILDRIINNCRIHDSDTSMGLLHACLLTRLSCG